MLTAVALCLLPTTWIVDAFNGPGTNFTDLPAAVAAAASGDTILVRAGVYSAFVVTAKALTIRGDSAGTTFVRLNTAAPLLQIDAVPGGAVFLLEGMSFQPQAPVGTATTAVMKVTGGLGTTTLGNCVLNGSSAVSLHALEVESGTVYAARCRFQGGIGFPLFAQDQSHGVAVHLGAFAAVDCVLVGGSVSSIDGAVAQAGSGLRVRDGQATLHDCSFRGGDTFLTRVLSGPGVQARGNSRVRIAGTSPVSVVPGAGTSGMPGILSDPSGSVIVHGSVTVQGSSGPVVFDAPLPRLGLAVSPRPNGEVPIGTVVTTAVDVPLPNAPFLLALGAVPEFSSAFAPLLLGELLLPSASFGLVGTLDAGGHWGYSFAPTATPLGIPLFGQAAVVDLGALRIRTSNFEMRVWTN